MSASEPQANEKETPMANDAAFAESVSATASASASSSATSSSSTSGANDARIADLELQVAVANDRALKATAELENFRKRVRREQEEELRYAALPLARDLLTVVDNLDRAIQAADGSTGGAGLLQGVKMVAVQFTGILEQHGCKRVAALGAEFDPNLHQAIGQEASADHPAGTVSKVAQAGYAMHDRVVRPAQVFVSTGAPSA